MAGETPLLHCECAGNRLITRGFRGPFPRFELHVWSKMGWRSWSKVVEPDPGDKLQCVNGSDGWDYVSTLSLLGQAHLLFLNEYFFSFYALGCYCRMFLLLGRFPRLFLKDTLPFSMLIKLKATHFVWVPGVQAVSSILSLKCTEGLFSRL